MSRADPNDQRRFRPPSSAAVAIAVLCSVSPWLSACAVRGAQRDHLAPGSPEASVGKARAPSSGAKPTSSGAFARTLESADGRLATALAALAALPTAESHRHVAAEYRRLGVLDLAHAHFTAAVREDPTDAASFDALARIWRDWGFAHLGLGDAYRAVHFAPSSPAAANTLGTLFDALGHPGAARAWYGRALALDPDASYALNNLCYAAIMIGDADAVTACRLSVAASPGSRVAGNNLGLAHAANGHFEKAHDQFQAVGGPAAADYNLGMVYMGTRQFKLVAESFGAALSARPAFALAAYRTRQAAAADRP